jgi:hypothetical protein
VKNIFLARGPVFAVGGGIHNGDWVNRLKAHCGRRVTIGRSYVVASEAANNGPIGQNCASIVGPVRQ